MSGGWGDEGSTVGWLRVSRSESASTHEAPDEDAASSPVSLWREERRIVPGGVLP